MSTSDNVNPPTDQLYAQPLDANGIAMGNPAIAVNHQTAIKSVDVSNALTNGRRYVVYADDTGVFLRRIDAATGSPMGADIQIQ